MVSNQYNYAYVLPHMRILTHTRMGRPIRVQANIRISGRTLMLQSYEDSCTGTTHLSNHLYRLYFPKVNVLLEYIILATQ